MKPYRYTELKPLFAALVVVVGVWLYAGHPTPVWYPTQDYGQCIKDTVNICRLKGYGLSILDCNKASESYCSGEYPNG